MEYEVDQTIEPINEDPTATPELRALYEGDISTTILEKLSAYYTEHSDPLEKPNYFIVRQSQSEYILYYGDISSSGAISDATVVRYYGYNTGSYTAVYRLNVSQASSGSVDLSGPTGYIYSSYDRYLPSPYIVTGKSSVTMGLWVSVLSCVVLCATVGVIVWRWLNAHNRK